MGKPRTKRQQLREERKQKRKAQQEANIDAKHDLKRRRTDDGDEEEEEGGDFASHEHDEPSAKRHDDGATHFGGQAPEREFFGMLADDEQEYFRRADELLELNQFPSEEERDVFLQNVYREAVGKELKLASSQSLSRLMERLILLSTKKQKKQIFGAFAGHFMSLVQHRFASHCCEALFLQSAPVVTQELGEDPGIVVDTRGGAEDGDEPENSMENLFLLTLDEFEEHLSFLLTDRFASHTLRVLLVVLSGRPLEDSSTRSLLKSKKKEHISVQGFATTSDETQTQLRAVPSSFTMATKKIIQDATAGMDFTSLRVLAKHPTGNPLLQLLLELDIALNQKDKSADSNQATLLYKLLPDAPASLSNAESEASDLVNSLMYDQIGSRLLETLITHAPGKIFKALHANVLGPRIATYVRNDVASYPALRALNRFSKDDLVEAVDKIIPIMPVLVSKARYNVIKTLYERCAARSAPQQIPAITKALTGALGSNSKELVPKLCCLEEEAADEEKPKFQQDAQNKTAMAIHGSHLVSTMLSTPGAPCKTAQGSLLALSQDQLFTLATRSSPSATVLTTALSQPSHNELFHKSLVAALLPRAADLALSPYGHRVIEAIPPIPSRPGTGRSIPFHVKQTLIAALAARESELRESWAGRSAWRAWKGDMWKTRRSDWVKWAKEVDAPAAGGDGEEVPEVKLKPWQKMLLKKKEAEAAGHKGPKGKEVGSEKNKGIKA